MDIPSAHSSTVYPLILHVIWGNSMFFFPLCFSQSAATWFLHQSPYCFGFSHFSDAYPSTSQVSKLWHPISNALCNYVIFYCTCDWLRFNIGRDKQTNSQHKLPPYRQENVRHFRNFCLRLAGRDPSTTMGNPNPRYFCINVCTVTVCLTSTDSPMLWTNFPINQSIYFRGSQSSYLMLNPHINMLISI